MSTGSCFFAFSKCFLKKTLIFLTKSLAGKKVNVYITPTFVERTKQNEQNKTSKREKADL